MRQKILIAVGLICFITMVGAGWHAISPTRLLLKHHGKTDECSQSLPSGQCVYCGKRITWCDVGDGIVIYSTGNGDITGFYCNNEHLRLAKGK